MSPNTELPTTEAPTPAPTVRPSAARRRVARRPWWSPLSSPVRHARVREAVCRPGFTLIELIVVIAIIAALAAVVAPAIFRNVGDAKAGAAKSQLEVFGLALQQYRLDTDAFPTTEQGLAALRTPPVAPGADGQPAHNWRGPYLTRAVPLDPWGRPYHYVAPGTANPGSYDLYTLGRDGTVGGTGEDADLTSWGGVVGDGSAVPPTAATATGSTAGSAATGQAQADQVVRRVADHGLVEVADLDLDAALRVGDRAEVAQVAVAADPDRRARGQRLGRLRLQPFVELARVAAHVGVRGARHLQVAAAGQDRGAILGTDGLGLGRGHVGFRKKRWCRSRRSRRASRCRPAARRWP